MTRYNTKSTVPAKPTSPIRTVSSSPTALTHEGGPGYENDPKGQVFRLGVNLFAGGENTFYENGKVRDARFGSLISQLANSDPEWTLNFLTWLRDEGNIRTASILGAVYAIHARLTPNVPVTGGSKERGYNRLFAAQVPQRLDEVPELFAIWQALKFGSFPQPLKRGAADALNRLANEYSMMKYDTSSHAWRVADILSLARVKPDSPAKAALYKMALENRYGSSFNTELLPMVAANAELRKQAQSNPKVLLDPQWLKRAGMTWEDALSLAGSRVPKNELWEALILGGSVGYMAMLRNLRNFQEAGISREATEYVKSRLADPQAVAKSRQFPFRFWSAFKNARGSQWAEALETALNLSTGNVPVLDGDNVVLIDTSSSMAGVTMSGKSTIRRDELAALYGACLALKNPGSTEIYMFANSVAEVKATKGDSILRIVEEVVRRNGEVGYGTETARSLKAVYRGQDRVAIFTDMQSFGGYDSVSHAVPANVWLYAWDLGGYTHGDIPSGVGRRHQLGGLTDATMKAIPLLERGSEYKWPWQNS